MRLLCRAIWFRNTWTWKTDHSDRPWLPRAKGTRLAVLARELGPGGRLRAREMQSCWLPKTRRMRRGVVAFWRAGPDAVSPAKDAFHDYIIHSDPRQLESGRKRRGRRRQRIIRLDLAPGETAIVRLRFFPEGESGRNGSAHAVRRAGIRGPHRGGQRVFTTRLFHAICRRIRKT